MAHFQFSQNIIQLSQILVLTQKICCLQPDLNFRSLAFNVSLLLIIPSKPNMKSRLEAYLVLFGPLYKEYLRSHEIYLFYHVPTGHSGFGPVGSDGGGESLSFIVHPRSVHSKHQCHQDRSFSTLLL